MQPKCSFCPRKPSQARNSNATRVRTHLYCLFSLITIPTYCKPRCSPMSRRTPQGNHRTHNFLMYRSVAGGCCDCGDSGAWKVSGFCMNHKVCHCPQRFFNLTVLFLRSCLLMKIVCLTGCYLHLPALFMLKRSHRVPWQVLDYVIPLSPTRIHQALRCQIELRELVIPPRAAKLVLILDV